MPLRCRHALAAAREDNAALLAELGRGSAAGRGTAASGSRAEALERAAAAAEVAGAALSARLAAEERVRAVRRVVVNVVRVVATLPCRRGPQQGGGHPPPRQPQHCSS